MHPARAEAARDTVTAIDPDPRINRRLAWNSPSRDVAGLQHVTAGLNATRGRVPKAAFPLKSGLSGLPGAARHLLLLASKFASRRYSHICWPTTAFRCGMRKPGGNLRRPVRVAYMPA
jgi:hypothetical protein